MSSKPGPTILTPQKLASLARAAGSRQEFKDSSGLTIRSSAGGEVSYTYVYREPLEGVPARARPQRRILLGRFPAMSLSDARRELARIKGELAQGRDPQPVRTETAPPVPVVEDEHAVRTRRIVGEETLPGSVADLVVSYIRLHVVPNLAPWPAWRGLETILRKWIVPAWGSRPVGSLIAGDLVRLLAAVRAAGGNGAASTGNRTQSNRVQAVAHGLMSFAVDMGLRPDNPFAGRRRSKDRRERPRERVLSDGEVVRLWRFLDSEACSMSPQVRVALRLTLLTGQRPGDVCSMQRADIRGRWWERRQIKTGEPHRAWLPELAMLELQRLRAHTGSTAAVFPAVRREDHLAETTLVQAMQRLCRDLEMPRATPHDLRRTAATRMEELGAAFDVVTRGVLGHVVRNRADRPYLRSRLEAQAQEAWELWARRIEELLGIQKEAFEVASPGARELVSERPASVAQR